MGLHRKDNLKYQESIAALTFFFIAIVFAHEDHSKVI